MQAEKFLQMVWGIRLEMVLDTEGRTRVVDMVDLVPPGAEVVARVRFMVRRYNRRILVRVDTVQTAVGWVEELLKLFQQMPLR